MNKHKRAETFEFSALSVGERLTVRLRRKYALDGARGVDEVCVVVADELVPDHSVDQGCEHRENHGQRQRMPERQSQAKRAHPAHSVSLRTYPAPRTVWIRREASFCSVLRRR